MTTIVTNGKFLIADRRGHVEVNVQRVAGGKIVSDVQESQYDDTCKIYLPNQLEIKGWKVMAIACSGPIAYHLNLMDIDQKISGGFDMEKFGAGIDGMICAPNQNGTIVSILENGWIVKQSLTAKATGAIFLYDVDTSVFKSNQIIAAGSGAAVIRQMPPTAYDHLDVQDVFALCAHTDKWSSDSYSAYSLEENHLYEVVNPSNREIQDAVLRAQFGLKFFNPEIKPKASVKF